ncbi:hypothetical protein DFH11DRAFT_1069057 [Phellopilus nigrolimitatus]|nr:hypothetical protein DFH11DRAFT_1069057 [Phellopilus nigrolimitatus]
MQLQISRLSLIMVIVERFTVVILDSSRILFFWEGHCTVTGNEKRSKSINQRRRSSTNNKNVMQETDVVFGFPEGSLVLGQSNVKTIVRYTMIHT